METQNMGHGRSREGPRGCQSPSWNPAPRRWTHDTGGKLLAAGSAVVQKYLCVWPARGTCTNTSGIRC